MGDVGGYADGFMKTRDTVSKWNQLIVNPARDTRVLLNNPIIDNVFNRMYMQFSMIAQQVFERDKTIWISDSDQRWSIWNKTVFKYGKMFVGSSFLYTDYSVLLKTCSYSLPLVSNNGGFHHYQAHTIPALMLNRLLPVTEKICPEVVTYVLCQGNGIGGVWWEFDHSKDERIANHVLDYLFGSGAFESFCVCMNRGFAPGKTVKRLCIWIKDYRHVFMLVWEKLVDTQGMSVCFAVDNLANNPFREVLLDMFILRMGVKFPDQSFSRLRRGVEPLGKSHIDLDSDMKCVSFMARSTLYLSMINRADLMWVVSRFRAGMGIEFERANYRLFEKRLLQFVKNCLFGGRTVWLSHISGAFVDINDVKLLSVLPDKANISSGRIPYVYAGAERGFVPESELGVCSLEGSVVICPTQSCYPPLAHVRECRLALEEGLQRLG